MLTFVIDWVATLMRSGYHQQSETDLEERHFETQLWIECELPSYSLQRSSNRVTFDWYRISGKSGVPRDSGTNKLHESSEHSMLCRGVRRILFRCDAHKVNVEHALVDDPI